MNLTPPNLSGILPETQRRHKRLRALFYSGIVLLTGFMLLLVFGTFFVKSISISQGSANTPWSWNYKLSMMSSTLNIDIPWKKAVITGYTDKAFYVCAGLLSIAGAATQTGYNGINIIVFCIVLPLVLYLMLLLPLKQMNRIEELEHALHTRNNNKEK